MKFTQVAVASNPYEPDVVFALGEDGNIYELYRGFYGPGSTYKGRFIQRGRANTEPFWRKLDLPFTEPPLAESDIDRLEFQEDRQ